MRADAETAAGNIDAALSELAAKTGISMGSVSRTCVGTAGDGIPLVVDWLREAMGARVAGELLLLGDVEIALDAAFPGASGLLVLAGTGSNVAGRMRDGTLTFLLEDGGRCWPIRAQDTRSVSSACALIFMAKDEGRSTTLKEAVRKELWQLASLDALVELANCPPSPDFSTAYWSDVAMRGAG